MQLKKVILAALAAGSALVGMSANADVFLPSSGNGELTLFVRNETTGDVFAAGLGVRMDSVATESQLLADPDYQGIPQSTPQTVPSSFTFAPYTNSALSTFMSAAGDYTWSIMGGDNTEVNENGIGGQRYASTISQLDPTQSPQIINGLLYSGMGGNLEALQTDLNLAMGGAEGSGSVLSTGGLWGTPGTNGELAPDWFGSGMPSGNLELNSPAGFYLYTGSGGSGFELARLYQIGSFSLSSTGTLSFAPVPLPAAAWLLLSALGGLGIVGRRKA